MKTTRHSLLAKGILVLLSLLILVFIFTFAWYTPPNIPVYGRGVQVHTAADADFEYAVGFYNSETGGNYYVTGFSNSSDTLDLEHLRIYDGTASDNDGVENGVYYHQYNLLVDYKPIDVTGDGATLIRPSMEYSNSMVNTDKNDYSVANPNVQYISFDLILRSRKSGGDIKLGSLSYAKGACEVTPKDGSLIGALASNKSTYGNFSKDAVVGAIRVAFIEYDDDYLAPSNIKSNTDSYLNDKATLLWLPRPDIKLNEVANATNGWTLTSGLTSSSANAGYTYVYDKHNNSITTDTFTHTYYKIFKGANSSANHTVTEYDDTVTDLTTAQRIATINLQDTGHVVDNETYNYTKVKVRIWVEGTDLESRRAISGGQFSVNFELTSN